jgi:hypothetical protein
MSGVAPAGETGSIRFLNYVVELHDEASALVGKGPGDADISPKVGSAVEDWALTSGAMVPGLLEALHRLPDQDLKDRAFDGLWRLMSAAHFLGAASGSERLQREKASAMREAFRRDVAIRQAMLRDIILDAAGDTQLVASRAFAESLVDGVKARMGDIRGTSAATIERTVRRILEERREG